MGIQGKIEIINLIQNGFDELLQDAELSNPQNRNRRGLWSRKIKTSLCDVGNNLGYYVCANRVNIECANHGEWLYDVTWIEYEEDRIPATRLKEIPFVTECEWVNNQDVKEDFEKLLQARAGIRLMICNGWKRSNENFAQEVAERLANMVGEFNDSQSNDVNILVTWKRVEGAPYQWNFRFFELGPGNVEPIERLC